MTKGSESGSVYVFARSEGKKLHAGDGGTSNRSSYSVSISADGMIALIAAYTDDDRGTSFGSATYLPGLVKAGRNKRSSL
jgi:hypothetical protein